MTDNKSEPLRDAPVKINDNGQPSWQGMCSYKNISVHSACYSPVPLPGKRIFNSASGATK